MNSPRDCFARMDPVSPPVAVQPLGNTLTKCSPQRGAPFGKA